MVAPICSPTIQPSNPTSRYLFKESENTNLTRYTHPYVQYSIIYNSPEMEATKCPSISQWRKRWHIHTMEHSAAIREKSCCLGHHGRPGGYCAKQNKSDRERQIPPGFTYRWNLKRSNELTKQKQTHRDRSNGWFPEGSWVERWKRWRGMWSIVLW